MFLCSTFTSRCGGFIVCRLAGGLPRSRPCPRRRCSDGAAQRSALTPGSIFDHTTSVRRCSIDAPRFAATNHSANVAAARHTRPVGNATSVHARCAACRAMDPSRHDERAAPVRARSECRAGRDVETTGGPQMANGVTACHGLSRSVSSHRHFMLHPRRVVSAERGAA